MRMETRVIEDGKYQVHYKASGNDFDTKNRITLEYDAEVEFSYDPEDYGNGYYMGIKSKGEAFGRSRVDVRYDKTFSPKNKMSYITNFFVKRYANSWDGSWELKSISINLMQ